MTDSEYDLTISKKSLGPLYPILKDAHGNIIDGFHRQNADPDWPAITLDLIDNPVKLELARLAANSLRRVIPGTEMQQRIGFLIGSGLKPDEIAEKTGLSKTTVYKYMPQGLKDEKHVEAGRAAVGSHANQTVTTQDTTERVEQIRVPPSENIQKCQRCGHPTHIVHLARMADGKDVCPMCRTNFYKAITKTDITTGKPATQAETVKDKWEYRAAQMKPGVSKMDMDMLARIQNNRFIRDGGWKVEFQKTYVIKTVTSDLTLVKEGRELAFFWDGVVHEGKEDRDEKNRELLVKYNPTVKVHSCPYKADTDKEKDALEAQVVEATKF